MLVRLPDGMWVRAHEVVSIKPDSTYFKGADRHTVIVTTEQGSYDYIVDSLEEAVQLADELAVKVSELTTEI